MTQLTLEPLALPGVRIGDENPLPHFREAHVNRPDDVNGLPEEKCQYLGWQTGFRVLTYRMQDQYTRQRQPLKFQSLVLENEILKAVFLPQLGEGLISLFHKDRHTQPYHGIHVLVDQHGCQRELRCACSSACRAGALREFFSPHDKVRIYQTASPTQPGRRKRHLFAKFQFCQRILFPMR